MSALQGMDMNQFIIIAPTVLIVIYVVITLQKKLSNSRNVHYGLIIPVICFIAATILAFRPLLIVGGEEGMLVASLTVWMTFNIPTLALLFPYLMALKNRKANQLIQEAIEKETAEADAVDAESEDAPNENEKVDA